MGMEALLARLTAKYLPMAHTAARDLFDGSMPMEDLRQEAALGLVLALTEQLAEGIPGAESEADIDKDRLRESVRSHLKMAMADEAALKKEDDRLVAQVELLSESINRLREELGEKPTVDELANDLGIQQAQVIRILQLMGEDIGEQPSEELDIEGMEERFKTFYKS